MNCAEARNLIDDWLDDALTIEQADEVDRHRAACPACRSAFDQARRLVDDMVSLGNVADRIAMPAALPRIAPRLRRSPLWRAVAMVALAAGVFAVLKYSPSRKTGIQLVDSTVNTTAPRQTRESATAGAGFNVSVDAAYLAVNMKSTDPKIHIVWLYDGPKPAESPGAGGPQPTSEATN